ncbi:DUF2971 domain-containing protein [Aliivibrio sp. EL58]|uniref:DUF2971 domain-containing protein n=1 Tax=Aliivibrio sp. EL58 TaxID=2107582 RepID=UPI000EFA8D98|nr:DUF2971 domain-containing protein [Aliivibrio sp. EL58]
MIFDNIYKFQSVNINSIAALANKQVWFSSMSSLNDPFEGLTKLIVPMEKNEVADAIKFVIEVLSEHSESIPENIEKIVRDKYLADPRGFIEYTRSQVKTLHDECKASADCIGVFSTASDIPGNDLSHVANMLLWSHYANGLKGFCLKFKAKSFLQSLIKNNPDSKFASTKMTYSNEPFEIHQYQFFKKSGFDYIAALQQKHEQWDYECECRLLSNNQGLMSFDSGDLDSVYIGEKMPLSEENLLLNIIENNYPNTNIYKVRVCNDQYGIFVGEKI